MLLESLQNLDLSNKVIITTMFSFGVSNLLSKSFLYSTIELKKLPFVPKLMKRSVYEQEVQEIVGPFKVYLHLDSSIQSVFEFLT